MRASLSIASSITAIVLSLFLSGCSVFTDSEMTSESSSWFVQKASKIPKSELVEMSILVTVGGIREVPSGSRIVISHVGGVDCATELKNALLRRLVDNVHYDILSRDHLEAILSESDQQWAGRFNTETATRLGEILGASLFLVGEVVYCGPSQGYLWDYGKLQRDWQGPVDIFAVLQVIDVETGKVIMSSANEGNYIPEATPLLFSASPEDYARLGGEASPHRSRGRRAFDKAQRMAGKLFQVATNVPGKVVEGAIPESFKKEKKDEAKEAKSVNYPAFKASEDLANGFADKFFARPIWERVEMWSSSYWRYGDSVRFVKLGKCQLALDLLRGVAATELSEMPERDVAEYLHNYGVALLCVNQPEEAIEKLQSAYRIGYHQSTLRMLGLADQMTEWRLDVKADEGDEVEMLIERGMHLLEN